MTDPSAPAAAPEVPADFSQIRYAQCWEDADVLVEGLDVQPGDVCLSIASAGDNALALLTRDPERVVAVDVSAAQLACLALRVAAYRTLTHGELLELIGSEPSERRRALYRRCRPLLGDRATQFWDERPALVERGIGAVGRFERYFRYFRRYVLPLTQSAGRVEQLLKDGRPRAERKQFYEERWNNWRWRGLFRVFFSQFVLGRLGRDPSFFEHVEGRVAERLLDRSRHALVDLDPAENPYLQWILTGRHRTARPLALREEHFDTIRGRLDRVEWHQASLEAYLDNASPDTFDAYNLSDVFEYVSPDHYQALLARCADTARPGARLAYWNLFVPRRRPDSFAHVLHPRRARAHRLHARDNTFFYGDYVLEDVIGTP
jgi:S-adenosylmethionine-diacylglycerol 3-amino-3-carboxypropyl transferase